MREPLPKPTPVPQEEPPPLLPRVALGDELAMRECIKRYGGLVYSIAKRWFPTEADDVVQDIFLDLWRSASSFDHGRAKEVTFVALIARRRIIDRRRSAKEPMVALDEVDGAGGVQRSNVEEHIDARNAAASLNELKDDQRRAVVLSACFGFSHSEIADELELPLGTVKAHISRGLARVRKALEP